MLKVLFALGILFIVLFGSYESSALGQIMSNSTNASSTNASSTNASSTNASSTNASLSVDEAMKKLGFANTITNSVKSKFGAEANVLYESPQTIILSGKPEEGSNVFWEALDFVKQSGYKVDAVAQITESDTIGNTRFLSPAYTIFLSK